MAGRRVGEGLGVGRDATPSRAIAIASGGLPFGGAEVVAVAAASGGAAGIIIIRGGLAVGSA